MRGLRTIACALLLSAGVAACTAETPSTVGGDAEARLEAEGDARPGPDTETTSPSASPSDARDPKGKAKKPKRAGGGSSVSSGGRRKSKKPRARAGRSRVALLAPAPGRYVYAQSGYERFCQAGRCEREPLPGRQPVDVTLGERTRRSVVVVSDAAVSRSRTVRTTMKVTPRGVLVTEVVAGYSYEELHFEYAYRPDPAVEAVRLPFVEGARWRGHWEAGTSGDYRIEVGSQETIATPSGRVAAYRLDTVMHLKGEFRGTITGTVWVDPRTLLAVKTQGHVDVESSFGAFSSRFTTTLSTSR